MLNAVQLKIAIAIVLGLGLIPFAMFRAWTDPPSFKSIKPCPDGSAFAKDRPECASGPTRQLVDEWSWEPLNKWYGNSEDGVSGKQAWVWKDTGAGTQLVPYMPETACPRFIPQKAWTWAYDFVRAVAWSVWRNNANNLKRPLRKDSLTGQVP